MNEPKELKKGNLKARLRTREGDNGCMENEEREGNGVWS